MVMFKFVKKHFATAVVLCLGIIATTIVCVYAFYAARAHAIFAASHPTAVVKYLNIHDHSLYSFLAIFFCGLVISVLLSLFFALRQREKKLVLDKSYLEQLVISEKKYKILFETSRDGIILIEPLQYYFVAGNPTAIKMFGCKDEKDLLSVRPMELSPRFQPDGQLSKKKVIEMVRLAREKGNHVFDWTYLKANGEEFTTSISLTKIILGNGKETFQASMRDVTEQRKAETKYKILFDTSRDAIMTLNPPNWSFTSGNKATVEMFKCKDEKHFILFAPYELSPEFQLDGKPSKEKALEMINTAMAKGSHFFDWMHKRSNGEEFPATVLLTRVEIEKGQPFLQSTVRDVTESKKAEKIILDKTHQLEELNQHLEEKVAERTAELNKKNIQLQDAHSKLKDSISSLMQAEKLSTIGEFAAGTVHELNNPLTGALNFVQYVLKHTEQDDKKYSILKDTEREIIRCISIVKNLLSFARGGREQQEEVVAEKISTIFEKVSLLVAYRVKKDKVEIATHFPENPRKIFMQVGKMQQVFLNLIINAMDALLESEIKKINITEEYIDTMVVITIEDTGNGIEPDKLDKIFSPFFTTKPKGVGTGLGLSIVRRTIEDHHGKIKCESQLGKGTKFIVTLPLMKKEEHAHE